MKFKNIIRVITLLPLFFYLLYCVFYFANNEVTPTYLDCGKVVSKSNDEIVIKHGVKTELYLNVNFNKSGFKSILCTPTTYFSKKIGDNVCFSLDENVSQWHKTNMLIGFSVIAFLTVVFILLFIKHFLMP